MIVGRSSGASDAVAPADPERPQHLCWGPSSFAARNSRPGQSVSNCMKLFRSRSIKTRAVTSRPGQPIETGTVRWLRSLDEALASAAETGKPVFALFQEVPGCAGCKQFGADVLSNPNIVRSVEDDFVPLLIHNNTDGHDAQVLAAYSEPAWNYQVVRFLDHSGVDIIERRDRVWETGPLASRMVQTLERSGREVPASLRLLEQEHSDRLETAYFGQPCFWVGERELGQIEGVVVTEAGFMERHEVTRVRFDPNEISFAELTDQARSRGVARVVYADDTSITNDVDVRPASKFKLAPDRDQKRQLGTRSPQIGLSLAQLTKLNAFTGDPDRARQFVIDR